MNKFYPGDRVRYVDHGLSIYGTVDRYNTAGDVVLRQDNGNFLTAAEKAFEPVPEMPFSPNADVVIQREMPKGVTSDGSTASYYELPEGSSELQHPISHRNMNAQIGEIFRACYRYGIAAHSPQIRDIKKIIFYAQAELERLEKLGTDHA